MKTLTLLLLSVIFGLSMLFTSCSTSQPIPPKAELDTRINDIWVIQTLNGNTVLKEKAGKQMPYIEFHILENKIFGNTGCNEFFGTAKYINDEITLSDIGATKMFCSEAEYETEFLQALKAGVMKYKIDNLKLTLTRD